MIKIKTYLPIFCLCLTILTVSCKKEPCDLSHIITSTVTDIDGQVYPTVVLDEQEWMAKNLNVSRFANGDSIIQAQSDSLWKITNDPAYSIYVGKLYNFHAIVDDRNICPSGWHVSTKADWNTLIECMGGEYVAGIKLKEARVQSSWVAPNSHTATNESQFTATPDGVRSEQGLFANKSSFAYLWGVDSDPTVFSLSYISEGIGSFEVEKRLGASVRCVRD